MAVLRLDKVNLSRVVFAQERIDLGDVLLATANDDTKIFRRESRTVGGIDLEFRELF
jgi:hypothetical protein